LIDRAVSDRFVASMMWTLGTTPDLVLTAPSAGASFQGDFTLLDVSTNADIFGVASTTDAPAFSIDGMALEATDRALAVYALPGISWEPVVNDVPPQPSTGRTHFRTTTGLPRFFAPQRRLVRVEPTVLLPHSKRPPTVCRFATALMSFPQTWDGATLSLNLLCIPSADPLAEPLVPGSPAFADQCRTFAP